MRSELKLLSNLYESNFEQFWPAFPCDEESIIHGVIGNTVQDINLWARLEFLKKTGKGDPPENMTGLW